MIAPWVRGLESVFGWLLETSWQASVLALLVIVVQRAFRSRLNPRWNYLLWLLVVLRLIMPAIPESVLSLFQFAPHAPTQISVTVSQPLFAPTALAEDELTSVAPAHAALRVTLYTLLALAWLAGAAVLLVVTWWTNRRFARQMGRDATGDVELISILDRAKEELGIARNVRLVESSLVQSPAIMGLFQPTLLLPRDARERFSAEELRLIFLHELAHLKRGDVAVQWLIAGLQILHWFNPVLWLAFRRMRIDREPATDALVLSRAGEEHKEHYGEMLIKQLEHFNQRHSIPTLVGILEDKDQFKRRFSLIAKFTRGAYGWSLLGVVLVIVLAGACLTGSKKDKSAGKHDETTTNLSGAALADGVVATVNGEVITLAELYKRSEPQERNLATQFLGRPDKVEAARKEIRAKALSELIDFRLIVQVARKDGIAVPEKVLDDRINDVVKTQFDGDRDQLFKVLKTNGISYEDYRTELREQVLWQYMRLKYVDMAVREELKDLHLPIPAEKGTLEQQGIFRKAKEKRNAEWMGGLRGAAKVTYAGEKSASVPKENPPLSREVSDQLREAAQKGDAVALGKWINSGADPKQFRDEEGQRSLLFFAGSPEVAELLIAKGLDVKGRDKAGNTALSAVCLSGTKNAASIARVLLQHGADPNARGQMGYTPVTFGRDGATVDVLVEFGADLNFKADDGSNILGFVHNMSDPSYFQALDRHGFSFAPKTENASRLLVLAARFNQVEVMRWLLDRGVDPNEKGIWVKNDKQGTHYLIPIKAAALSDVSEPIKILIEHGAKTDEAMFTALHNGNFKIVKTIWEGGGRSISELCYAISQGAKVEAVEKYLNDGIPADPPEDTRITPLALASQLGRMDLVKLLVERGADVNKGAPINPEYPIYWTVPVSKAASEGQDEVVEYLMAHGARTNARVLELAVSNSTPYEKQRSRDHFEKTVRILLNADVLLGATDEEKGAVLYSAIFTRQGGGNATVLKWLLDAGLSPELPMKDTVKGEIKSVIARTREHYSQAEFSEEGKKQLKPLLDMLEEALKKPPGAGKVSSAEEKPIKLTARLFSMNRESLKKLASVPDEKFNAPAKELFSRLLTMDGVGFIGALNEKDVIELFQVVDSMRGVDVLSAPTVWTRRSGQVARIQLTRQLRYPVEFGPIPGKPGETQPTKFESKDVGLILKLTPNLAPWGRVMDIDIDLELSSLEGFLRFKDQKMVTDEELRRATKPEDKLAQPVFNTRTIQTKVQMLTGQSSLVRLGLPERLKNTQEFEFVLLTASVEKSQ